MRNILSAFLTIAMVLIFTACGGSNHDGSTANGREPIADVEDNQDPAVENGQNAAEEPEGAKIKLIIDNEEFIVDMYDNPTSRELVARLPLTQTFKDFGGFEKMSVLEEGLTTEGAPEGVTPSAGDFGYYAPWNDIAIFYNNWNYSPGLISLGKVGSGIESCRTSLQVRSKILQ